MERRNWWRDPSARAPLKCWGTCCSARTVSRGVWRLWGRAQERMCHAHVISRNIAHDRMCDRSLENTSCALGTNRATICTLGGKSRQLRRFSLVSRVQRRSPGSAITYEANKSMEQCAKLAFAVCRRQWPEVSDFVARFCTLRNSKNLRPCENARIACDSRMAVGENRVWFSHGRRFFGLLPSVPCSTPFCRNGILRFWHKMLQAERNDLHESAASMTITMVTSTSRTSGCRAGPFNVAMDLFDSN